MMRISSIDRVRGLSVLGILLVNAMAFAMPLEVYSNPAWSPLPFSGADKAAWWFIETFFHEKFISLFSMLFGLSLFLVYRTAGNNPTPVIGRRLLFLLCVGLIHGMFIWDGDILVLYALTGMVFLLLMEREAKILLAYGAGLFVAGNLLMSANGLALEARHLLPAVPTQSIAQKITMMQGNFSTSLTANFMSWQTVIFGEIATYLPITLGLMMMGLGLFKVGFFDRNRAQIIRRTLKIAAGISLFLIAVQAYITQAENFNGLHIMGSYALINRFLSPLVGLGFAAILIELEKGILTKALEGIGRLAFSHYLSQSLIMTAIFFSGRAPQALGLGLYGQLNYAALIPIVLAIWVFQWVWGSLWQKRFRYGPLEYVWRCVTHAKLLPITH